MIFAGMKTFAFGAAVAVLPALLVYLEGVHWESLGIHPAVAAVIAAGVVVLRLVTTGPPKVPRR